jgi:uncharacterized protein (DUF433 family)
VEANVRKLVSSRSQAASNIRRFAEEIAGSPEMQSRLSQVHDWYALSLADGSWAFGPSKFIGYRDNTIKKYLETYRTKANGGETETALAPLSTEVDSGTKLERELTGALEEFLDRWGRKPRSGSQIRIVHEAEPDIEMVQASAIDRAVFDKILGRISSDPAICGGRPCIKGTRMRVVDIVEAVAQGVTREQLLRDFDYLTAEDIAAALLYAARASDHRVVRTA